MKKLFSKYKYIFIIVLILGLAVVVTIVYKTNKNVTKAYPYKTWDITFENSLMNTELEKENIAVIDSKKNIIKVTLTWSNGGRSIRVNPPSGGYKANETYYLRVGAKEAFSIEGEKKGTKIKKFKIIDNGISEDKSITFEDINLERIVRVEIKKPSGELHEGDINKITRLIATNCNIKDLAGIENLTSLEELYLDSNQIIDLTPIKSLKNLKELGLSRNKISNIDILDSFNNLRTLWLSENEISSFSPLKNIYSNLHNKDFDINE